MHSSPATPTGTGCLCESSRKTVVFAIGLPIDTGASGPSRASSFSTVSFCVSTLNFTANQTLANAAIVPLGAGGGITVAAALSNTELLIDTNGYYAAAGVGAENTFLGVGAGNFTMTGDDNSAFGQGALFLNTSGNFNTAMGVSALGSNTTGEGNTASWPVSSVSGGTGNTASGQSASISGGSGLTQSNDYGWSGGTYHSP